MTKKCFIFVDLNIDLIQNSLSIDKYFAIIAQIGFNQLLDFLTRETGTNTTLFDHVLFNERVNSI